MIVRELVTKLGFDVDESKLKKLDTTLDKTKGSIKDVSNSIDSMKQSLGSKVSVKRYFVDDVLEKHLKETAKEAKEEIKQTNEALSKFVGVVNKAKYAIAGLVGTFTGLSALSLSVAKDAIALESMAKQLGITTEDLQTLELVAQQTGSEVGLLTKSFSKFNKDLNTANFSKTLGAKELSKLGVSVYQANGKLRDSKDVFVDVAKKINNISDTSKQAALSQKLLGTTNLSLVKTLALNSEEFAKQRAEVLKLGYVLDSKGIKSSQNFIKSWSQFKMIIDGLRQELSVKFMPVFTNMVDKFKEWYGENRKLISSGIDNFVNITSKSFDLLLKTIDLLLTPLKAITDLFGGIENTVQILGITLIFSLIPKLKTLIGVFNTLKVAMLTNPIGLATAAFIALGLAVGLVYNDIDAWMNGNKSLIGYLIDEWKIFEKVLKGVQFVLTSIATISDKIKTAFKLPKIFDLGGLVDPTGLLRNLAAKNQENLETEGVDLNKPENQRRSNGKIELIDESNLFDEDDPRYKKLSVNQGSPYMNPANGSSISSSRNIRNNITQTISEVNITVPAGTTQEQAVSINEQVVDIIQEQLSQFTLRGMDALNNR